MSGPSSRMLQLLSLLQVRRDWAGDLLAARLEVSPRTVRRDVDRLRELGYRIESVSGPAGGYRLASGSELPPLLFDDDQAVAIALALAVAPISGADIAEAATRALATVRQVMPARLRHRVDAVEVVPTYGATVVDPEILVAVSDATRKHEALRFDYPSASQPGRRCRRVEPHAVIARHGRWYLLAWDGDSGEALEGGPTGDWRTFRIDRIVMPVSTGRLFEPRPVPGGDPGVFVAARFKGSATADAWPCIGTAVVSARAGHVEPFVDDDATVEELGPSRTAVTIGSWSWGALAARFASFDVTMAIVGPPELREAASEVGRRLLRALDST